jgi:hypothetical protein
MRSANMTHTEVALSDKLSSRRAYRPKNTQGPIIVEIEDEEKNDNESQLFMRDQRNDHNFEGIEN